MVPKQVLGSIRTRGRAWPHVPAPWAGSCHSAWVLVGLPLLLTCSVLPRSGRPRLARCMRCSSPTVTSWARTSLMRSWLCWALRPGECEAPSHPPTGSGVAPWSVGLSRTFFLSPRPPNKPSEGTGKDGSQLSTPLLRGGGDPVSAHGSPLIPQGLGGPLGTGGGEGATPVQVERCSKCEGGWF